MMKSIDIVVSSTGAHRGLWCMLDNEIDIQKLNELTDAFKRVTGGDENECIGQNKQTLNRYDVARTAENEG